MSKPIMIKRPPYKGLIEAVPGLKVRVQIRGQYKCHDRFAEGAVIRTACLPAFGDMVYAAVDDGCTIVAVCLMTGDYIQAVE